MTKNNNIAVYLTLLLFIILSANVSSFAQKTANSKKTSVISPLPTVIKVNEITIKDLLKPKDKPLLINFWATWCVPCREEFPELVEIDKEYKDKIDFITISLDDLAEINRDVPKFLKEMKATMPAYLLKTNDENGVISSVSKDWEGGLPFTILYDEKGGVAHTKQGKIKIDIVKNKLNSLIKPGEDGKTSEMKKPCDPDQEFTTDN
jgi:thiol-disulfide isomerase/thioredoxin